MHHSNAAHEAIIGGTILAANIAPPAVTQAGDAEGRERSEVAAAQFVNRYQDLVINTCCAFLRDPDDAHDVAQEVLVSALRLTVPINSEAEWRAWLYRAAARRSLNELRNRKRRRWLGLLSSPDSQTDRAMAPRLHPGSTAREPARPDRELEDTELRFILENAIAKLPDRQRIAFTLQKFEDLTNVEIGAVLQMKSNAVDALLHRARQRLRKHLMKYYEDYIDR